MSSLLTAGGNGSTWQNPETCTTVNVVLGAESSVAAQLFHIVEVASTTVVLLGPRKHVITLGLTCEEKAAIHVSNAARVGGIELWAAVKNKIHLHKITRHLLFMK
jgi:hypothetical protein